MGKLDLRNIPPELRSGVVELEKRDVHIGGSTISKRDGWNETKAEIAGVEVYTFERDGKYKVAVSAVPKDIDKLPTMNKTQAAHKVLSVALEVTKP